MSDQNERSIAERMLKAELNDPHDNGHFPFHRAIRLSDLWEADQEKYLRMARAATRGRLS